MLEFPILNGSSYIGVDPLSSRRFSAPSECPSCRAIKAPGAPVGSGKQGYVQVGVMDVLHQLEGMDLEWISLPSASWPPSNSS